MAERKGPIRTDSPRVGQRELAGAREEGKPQARGWKLEVRKSTAVGRSNNG